MASTMQINTISLRHGIFYDFLYIMMMNNGQNIVSLVNRLYIYLIFEKNYAPHFNIFVNNIEVDLNLPAAITFRLAF